MYYTHICSRCAKRSGSGTKLTRDLTIELCDDCKCLTSVKKPKSRNKTGIAKPNGRPRKNVLDDIHVGVLDNTVRIGMFINLPDSQGS